MFKYYLDALSWKSIYKYNAENIFWIFLLGKRKNNEDPR